MRVIVTGGGCGVIGLGCDEEEGEKSGDRGRKRGGGGVWFKCPTHFFINFGIFLHGGHTADFH